MTAGTQERAARIALWGGSTKSGNQFVDIYARSLAAAGFAIIDVKRPLALDPRKMDVLHIHWPDQLFWARKGLLSDTVRTWLFLRLLRKAKRAGVKIVWMVHNIDPHDLSGPRRRLWEWYRRSLCNLLDGFMTVSPGTLETVRAAMPALRDKPAAAPWHVAYPPMPVVQDREALRTTLGVEVGGRLFGSLGYLRPYKGTETLIEAFRATTAPQDRLVIGGKPLDAAYHQKIRTLAEADPRIILIAEALDDQYYADLERACDFIVLPFVKSLHSGSLIHAVSNGVAAITPASPFSHALGEEVGEGWVRSYEGELRAADLEEARVPAGVPRLDALSSETVGRQAGEFYRRLIG